MTHTKFSHTYDSSCDTRHQVLFTATSLLMLFSKVEIIFNLFRLQVKSDAMGLLVRVLFAFLGSKIVTRSHAHIYYFGSRRLQYKYSSCRIQCKQLLLTLVNICKGKLITTIIFLFIKQLSQTEQQIKENCKGSVPSSF